MLKTKLLRVWKSGKTGKMLLIALVLSFLSFLWCIYAIIDMRISMDRIDKINSNYREVMKPKDTALIFTRDRYNNRTKYTSVIIDSISDNTVYLHMSLPKNEIFKK